MSRLSDRMGAGDAVTFASRANDAHHFKIKADVYSMKPGDLLAADIPIVGGKLTMDSSNPTRRELRLEVAGEEYIPRDASSLLAPIGRRILLYVSIDRLDGSWLPWLKLGEFPIITTVVERPATKVTIDCGDYSTIVDEYLMLNGRSFKGVTLKDAIVDLVQSALPDRVFGVHASSHATTSKFQNYVADPGKGRWATCLEMADKKGQETFFDYNGDLVIRYDRTVDDENVIAGTGPDIGTVSDPVAVLSEGQTGNIVALTSSLSRRGAANGVRFILTAPDGKWKYFTSITSGLVAWGDSFGRLPIVQTFNVNKITQEKKNDYTQRAQNLLRRRRGLVRYLDMDVTPIYWLEPDDTVQITWAGATEYHYVSRVEMDLSGRRPMRVRTRQLAVDDPG